MKLLIATLALVAAASAAVVKREVKIPEYFPKACARNAPNLNECIRNNMQTVMPRLDKGEGIFGLQPLDPLNLDPYETSISYSPFNFVGTVPSCRVHGPTKVKIREVRAKLTDDKMDMEIDVFYNKLFADGQFRIKGKFGDLPLNGHGPWNMTVRKLEGTIHLTGQTVVKDGEKYMQITRAIPKFKLGGLIARTDNLVEGNPELSLLAINAINRFWRPLVAYIMPAHLIQMERYLKGFASKVFDSVPYAQLFPAA